MPKRVLSISHFYVTNNRGGGEVMLHEVLKSLVAEGYQVDAVATDNSGDSEILDGVRVFKGKQFTNMLSKKYDLVVTQFGNANWVLKESQKLGIPTVYIVHNNMTPTTLTLNEHVPTLTVFNTHWIKDYYKYKHNCIVVHPPVYAEQHKTKPGDRITLINLIPSKGAYTFYNMAQRFPRQKFMGVVGGYYENQQVILKRPNVTIAKNTSDMKRDVWSKTKILLMPSEYESYGMAGVEALASGIPVIANPTPGLKESLGYAGIFPSNNTIGAWTKAIASLSKPGAYEAASKLALQRSAEIDPRSELDEFIKAVKKII